MILHNENYTIKSATLFMPPLTGYDVIYNPEAVPADDLYSVRDFHITHTNGTVIHIALLDHSCSSALPYAVLEDHMLTVILFESIVRIDARTGAMPDYVPCPNIGGLMEIHAIKDGYILYGESEIFRYDRALHRIWEFSGRDIFVSLDHPWSFRLEENEIHVRDFLGWHYIVSMDGKLLHELMEEV